jgi:hypothetical protein
MQISNFDKKSMCALKIAFKKLSISTNISGTVVISKKSDGQERYSEKSTEHKLKSKIKNA